MSSNIPFKKASPNHPTFLEPVFQDPYTLYPILSPLSSLYSTLLYSVDNLISK
jgi:hypothetical protein